MHPVITTLWSAGLTGGGTGWEFGDFDYDGTINSSSDYDLWSAGFAGQGSPLSVGVQPVPEPSTLLLAALGLSGLGAVRFGQRRKRTSACATAGPISA